MSDIVTEVVDARTRYSRGPVGSWVGDGNPHYRIELIFHEDQTGDIVEGGLFGHHYFDDMPAPELHFSWKCLGERHLAIEWNGEKFDVRYDFEFVADEYGNFALRMFEVGVAPDSNGWKPFWISPMEVGPMGEQG